MFGAGYRRYDGDDLGEAGFFFDPRQRTSHRVNVFAQDEIGLGRGVFMTVGSKLERNEFSGWELQPTIRGRWSAPRRSVWGAISRAVRVPTRFDTDLRIRGPGGAGLVLDGVYGLEGPGWILPDVTERMADPSRRERLLQVARMLEAEPAAVGWSAHLLAVARRP